MILLSSQLIYATSLDAGEECWSDEVEFGICGAWEPLCVNGISQRNLVDASGRNYLRAPS